MVAVGAYSLDLTTFAVLHSFFPEQLVAVNVTARCVGGLCSFTAHKLFTFRSPGAGSLGLRETVLYLMLFSVNVPASSAILVFLAGFLPVVFAKPISDTIGMGVNFYLCNRFIFRPRA